MKTPSILMKIALWMIALLGILQITPARMSAWQFSGDGLVQNEIVDVGPGESLWVESTSVDLDDDGRFECTALSSGSATISDCGEKILWQSPDNWQVKEAFVSDLNRDGKPEVTLLVWRLFMPWPIDSFLPHGGRIKDFHDQQGLSCHLILIGWNGKKYVEKWAGSALIRPVEQLSAVDLDGDGGQELVGLEGQYDGPYPGGTLTVWRWRGFGFVLMDETEEWFRSIQVLNDTASYWVIAQ